MHSPSNHGLLSLLALAIFAGPDSVQAANMAHGRTPVLWPDAPCLVDVDRSADPSLAFTYTIPHEDTELTVDELADSRTHQFIGFCRQWPVKLPPPSYVSVSDLERAIAAGWAAADQLDDPEATLETSLEWAGCWTRITPDAPRRAITFAAASEPVVWDTSAIPAGTWSVAGYTWEPPDNLWRRAPWVVRVFDEADSAAPALALGSTPEVVWGDGSVEIALCVSADPADPEATIRLDWTTSKTTALVWTEGEPIDLPPGNRVTLPFAAPPATWGLTLMLRAHVESMGVSYDAHALEPIAVLEPAATDTDTDGETTESATSTGESSESGESGESGETSEAADLDETDAPGLAEPSAAGSACNCSADPARVNIAASLLGLFLLLAIRRPRDPP